MPARKLSQEAVDELHAAYDELSRSSPKQIIRNDGVGNADMPGWTGPKTISLVVELAAWKGIAESYFHALKRGGWKLKRGVPLEDRPDDGLVPAAVLRTTFDLLQERLEAKDRRIAELEALLRERDR
jgi:hypothetical protein